MSDALIVYCIFMYLFAGGVVVRSYAKSGYDMETAIYFITAPISTPILLGIIFSNDNQ